MSRRYLQLHPCDVLGGTELMVVRLAKELHRRNIACDVATLAPPGPIAAMLTEAGVPVHSLQSKSPRGIRRLASLLHHGRYDLVNAYGFTASMAARAVVKALRLPTAVVCGVQGLHVTEVEDMSSAKSRLTAWLEKAASPLVDRYDCNSPGAVRFLADLGIDRDKLGYVPMGIDPADWPIAEPASGSDPTVLSLARFVPRKRQIDLVEALCLLHQAGTPVKAILAGDGPTREAVRQRAEALGLSQAVAFPGALSPTEAKTAMRRASLFCLPSTWEGTPTVILEAMASGIPVVGTDVNGTADLVRHGETGLLVPPKRPDALAGALSSLLRDPAAAKTHALAARSLVESAYTVEVMVDEKLKLYETALSRSSR